MLCIWPKTIFIQSLSLLIQKDLMEISIYFNILIRLKRLKSYKIIGFYIKSLGTNLFCILPETSP